MQGTFGSRLKKHRKECGLTQEQLAEKLNIHERTVSRWERGVSNPDISMFGVLSDVLNVSLEELWGLPANKRIENGNFDLVSLGQKLAVQRMRLGESQGDLAQAVGVSSDTVSKWERGLVSPNIETFIALAKHFDIAPSALYYAQTKRVKIESDSAVGQGDAVSVRRFFNKRNLLILGTCAICLFVALALILLFCIKPPVEGQNPSATATRTCRHQYESVVVSPTCTAQGYTTYCCTKCGENYTADYTAKTEHNFGEWIVAREPTCSTAGSKYKECSVCGAKSESEVATIPHKYEARVTVPTCKAQGYTTYCCTVCGDSYQTDYTPIAAHTHEKKSVTPPTCTAQGYTTYSCTVCGENYNTDYTAKTEHDFGEWIAAREPTCTAAGSKYKTCSACGATSEAEEIATIPHEYKATVTAPTCTAQGYTTYGCSVCGDSYRSDYTAVTAHKYKATVTQPTCSTQGYTTYCCAACGNSYRSDYTETLPHTESGWETVREPSCSALGSQRKTCLVCHKTLEMTSIDKLSHNYTEQIVPPNGADAGYMLHTCTACGESYRDGNFTNNYNGIEYQCDYTMKTCRLTSAEGFTGSRLDIPRTLNGCTVTEIGWSAFSDCITLREVTIPDTVTKIDLYAFYRCALLEKVVIPDSVTFLGDEAFCGCRGLKEATLPKNITRIRYSTFSDCVNLRKIEIPQSVTVIEDLAFHNCPTLESIVLPDQLFSIGRYAFYGCSSLKRIELASTLVRIGDRAFEGCWALNEVVFHKKETWTADGTVLDGAALADSQKAAEYLTDVYCYKIWICE